MKDWAREWASVPGELDLQWEWASASAREELELVWLPVESAWGWQWVPDCCDLLSRKRRAGRRLKKLKELERRR